MALKFSFIANEESARQGLEAALRATGRATLAGRGLSLPLALLLSDPQIKQLQAQAPEAVIIDTPEDRPETALDLVSWIRSQMPLATIMVVGPMEPPQRIVQAMRAGANEYLEQPLRAAALEEALTHCAATRSPDQRPGTRGKLFAVLGARGGCGATTVAVNLALSLHSQRRESDPAVVLLDAAPLGHAALHLNLKPQFTLADLLAHANRLDAAMLTSLMQRHASGLELLAGPSAPLPGLSEEDHKSWVELLARSFPTIVVDLSARLDGLTKAVLEFADRILFVSQTDMVSLWSAAKVRQYLDASTRMRFELVLNRFNPSADVDLTALEGITHTPILWKLPNAHALVEEAIEHGQPPAAKGDSELATSYMELAANLLGRPVKKSRGWLPFLRTREVES